LKEEALDRTMWRNRFARGFGPVVWQITDDDDMHIVFTYNCASYHNKHFLFSSYEQL